MKSATKGILGDARFIEILKDAAKTGLTGMIRLENGPIIKVVYFQNGTISFASSNEKNDRLTEVLKRAGKLTPEQVEDAQSRLKPNVSLGKTLVELGYISAKDLLWGAHKQVDGILHQLLFWNQGKYQIIEGTLPREIIHLNLQVSHVIFDGIMKSQDRDWVLQRIGSPDSIYEILINPQDLEEPLKGPVSALTSKMNGKSSLHEIAQISGLDTFELCKTVVALEVLDLARPIQDEPMQMELNELEEEAFYVALDDQPIPTEIEDVQREKISPIPVEKTQQISGKEEKVEPEKSSPPPVHIIESPPEEIAFQASEPEAEESEPAQTVVESAYSEQQQPQPDIVPSSTEPLPEIVFVPETPSIGDKKPFNWKGIFTIVAVITTIVFAILYFPRTRENEDPQAPYVPKQKQPKEKPAPPPPVSSPVESRVRETAPPPVKPPPSANDPLSLLSSGKLPDAARLWKEQVLKNKKGYSIQVVIACQQQTVMDTHQLLNYSPNIIVLPMAFRGQNCYRVLLGQYPSRQLAQTAMQKLPAIFIRQRSPANVIALSQVSF